MKIFLGYASEHLSIAREINAQLVDLGHEVWFDKETLIPGVDWDQERIGGQEDADLIIHLCSIEIVSRAGVVNREIKKTLRPIEDQPFGAIFAVFIRLQDFPLPRELTNPHFVDYFSSDWLSKLKSTLKRREQQLSKSGLISPHQSEGFTERPRSKKTHTYADTVDIHERSAECPIYEETSLYWAFVNASIQHHVLSGFFSAGADFREYDEFDSKTSEGDRRKYAWELTSEQFFKSEDTISLRFTTYYDYGGAHPNYHITTLNFGGPHYGPLKINNIVKADPENANRILEYCKTVIRAGYPSEETIEFFEFEISESDMWELLSHFNLEKRGLTFNFSPYAISAYVYGSHEVLVPWNFLYDMINENYRAFISEL